VKIWDLRRLDKQQPPLVFTVTPPAPATPSAAGNSARGGVSMPGIVDVCWSPSRQGIIAVATSTHKSISVYSINECYAEIALADDYSTSNSDSPYNEFTRDTQSPTPYSKTSPTPTTTTTGTVNSSGSNANANISSGTSVPLYTTACPDYVKSISWRGTEVRIALTNRARDAR